MAKVNLKDATKGLVEEASELLGRANGMRREADALLDALRQIDMEMNRQKEEEEHRRKQQEQMKAQSTHTKAFTMLDEDEKQMMEAAMQEQPVSGAEQPDTKAKKTPKKAPPATAISVPTSALPEPGSR